MVSDLFVAVILAVSSALSQATDLVARRRRPVPFVRA
jgi:hypothetical protein